MPLPLSYNVRNVAVRWKASLLAVLGIALVVAVLIVLWAMSSGFRATLGATGTDRNAIVTQKGSQSELTSGISLETAATLAVDGRVARGADGAVLASPEMVVVANLVRRVDGKPTNVLVRGVTPRVYDVRTGIRVVEGRRPEPGVSEIMIGRRIRDRVGGLDLGQTVDLQRRTWRIVGIFESDGSGFESEIWGDADVMRQAFNRTGGWQSLTVRVVDPAAIPAWNDAIDRDPRYQVQILPERKYYADQAGPLGTLLLFLAGFVSTVMGIGAAFGAMNTMNGIIAARVREIGTLRALGFSRLAILVSFLVESALLALAGGLLGVVIALPFNGIESAAGNQFSELAFAFRITPAAIVAGVLFAVGMGVLGGLLPATRAARLPVIEALRDS